MLTSWLVKGHTNNKPPGEADHRLSNVTDPGYDVSHTPKQMQRATNARASTDYMMLHRTEDVCDKQTGDLGNNDSPEKREGNQQGSTKRKLTETSKPTPAGNQRFTRPETHRKQIPLLGYLDLEVRNATDRLSDFTRPKGGRKLRNTNLPSKSKREHEPRPSTRKGATPYDIPSPIPSPKGRTAHVNTSHPEEIPEQSKRKKDATESRPNQKARQRLPAFSGECRARARDRRPAESGLPGRHCCRLETNPNHRPLIDVKRTQTMKPDQSLNSNAVRKGYPFCLASKIMAGITFALAFPLLIISLLILLLGIVVAKLKETKTKVSRAVKTGIKKAVWKTTRDELTPRCLQITRGKRPWKQRLAQTRRQLGNWLKQLRERLRRQKTESNRRGEETGISNVGLDQQNREEDRSRIYIEVTIKNRTFTLLYDTGAQTNLISRNLLESIQDWENFPFLNRETRLRDHSGNTIPQVAKPRLLPIEIAGITRDTPFYITGDVNMLLGGMDLIIRHRLNMIHDRDATFILVGDFQNPVKIIRATGAKQGFPFHQKETWRFLEPCVSTVSENIPNPLHDRPNNCARQPLTYPIHVDQNETEAPTPQYTDDTAARFQDPETMPIEPEGYILPSEAEPHPAAITLLDNPKFFPTNFREPFLRFLQEEVPTVLSTGEYDMGLLTLDIPFVLELTDEIPVVSKPFKLNNVHQDIVDSYVDQLIEAGVFKVADSDYASPIFVVAKGARTDASQNDRVIQSARAVIDYRLVNAKTRPQNYPLPLISNLLNALANGTYYSSIDLRSAYNSCRLTEDVSRKAAVATGRSVIRPLRLPFGLRNAVPYFSSVIDRVLKDIKNAYGYLDDVVIRTKGSAEEHFELIKTVLRRFQECGLKLD